MTTVTSEQDAPVSAPTRRRRGVWVVGITAAVVAAGGVGWGVHHHGGVGTAPYVDKASAGALTFCRDGKPVTGGSTKDPELADAIVSGQSATGPFAAGGTASLFAYQPRQGIDPVSWSGLQLTGATPYAAGSAPTVKATANATTLAQFVHAFPAADGGWVQLRVVLGAPNTAAQTTAYATADLHIDGSTWTVADPGTASCH